MLERQQAEQARPDLQHDVIIYAHDAQLVSEVGPFLRTALVRGGTAVALATRQHLQSLDEWLALSGVDVAEAVLGGRYVFSPVEDLVGLLSPGNEIKIFYEQLNTLFDSRSLPAPIHVFGEVVGTLAQDGRAQAALEIDQLGATFAERTGADVLCAYPTDALDDQGEARVCAHHTHRRTPPPMAVFTSATPVVDARAFPSAVLSCRAVRQFVTNGVGGADALREQLTLVASELAANCVRHARSDFIVSLERRPGFVRLAVSDQSVGSTGVLKPLAGHGLGAVDRLAAGWGVALHPNGKTVWADLTAWG